MKPFADDHDQPKTLLHLSLVGLLPPDQQLVINPVARTVILFAQTALGEATILTLQQFSPNGMRILLPLLRAYPSYCTYETLLAGLSALPVEEARRQLREMRESALRSIRRAIGSLASGLHAFGLRVQSVRSTGYFIEAITPTDE